MNKLREIIKIEDDKEQLNGLYEYARDVFKRITLAAEENNKVELEDACKELDDIISLTSILLNNSDIKLKGSYIQFSSGLYELKDAVEATKDVVGKELSDLLNDILYNKWKDIYRRAYDRKYEGPDFDDDGNLRNKMEEVKNIDSYADKIFAICFNQMTIELPDYFDLHQVTEDIDVSTLIGTKELAEIIDITDRVSSDNAQIVGEYFRCAIGDKKYKIDLKYSPYDIVICCSDGRRIMIEKFYQDELRPEFDDCDRHIYITNITVSFPTRYNIILKSAATVGDEYNYPQNTDEIIEQLQKPVTPSGKVIDWRYIAYHKTDYLTEEELRFIAQEYKNFVNGITHRDPTERIMMLAKSLGTREKEKLMNMLKGTNE